MGALWHREEAGYGWDLDGRFRWQREASQIRIKDDKGWSRIWGSVHQRHADVQLWVGVSGGGAGQQGPKAREGGAAAKGCTGQKAGGQLADQGKVTVRSREDLEWNEWLEGRSREGGCWFAGQHERLRHIVVAKDLGGVQLGPQMGKAGPVFMASGR